MYDKSHEYKTLLNLHLFRKVMSRASRLKIFIKLIISFDKFHECYIVFFIGVCPNHLFLYFIKEDISNYYERN